MLFAKRLCQIFISSNTQLIPDANIILNTFSDFCSLCYKTSLKLQLLCSFSRTRHFIGPFVLSNGNFHLKPILRRLLPDQFAQEGRRQGCFRYCTSKIRSGGFSGHRFTGQWRKKNLNETKQSHSLWKHLLKFLRISRP